MTKRDAAKTISHVCLDLKISTIKYLGEGDFCEAYLVNKELVFRFAKHDAARRSLQREVCLLPKIAGQIKLQIPSPHISSLDKNVESPFVAYPILPGQTLSRKKYLAFTLQNRTACAEQIAGFLNQLHSINIEQAQNCNIPVNNYEAQYSDLPCRARKDLSAFLTESELLFIEKSVTDYFSSGDAKSFRTVLLHGDLSPNHILFNKETSRVSGIIDFGDMMIGDPAWDFLWIYEDYGSDFLSRTLRAYNETDQNSFLRRIYRFSVLQAIEWVVDCRESGSDDLTDAINRLRTMSK